MDFYDFLYEEYLKDVENGETNLTWEEYLEYCLQEPQYEEIEWEA